MLYFQFKKYHIIHNLDGKLWKKNYISVGLKNIEFDFFV